MSHHVLRAVACFAALLQPVAQAGDPPICGESEVLDQIGTNLSDAYIQGDFAYVANGRRGMSVFDISVEPFRITASLGTDTLATSIDADGDLAVIGAELSEVLIVDISDPHHPRITATIDGVGKLGRVDIELEGRILSVATEVGNSVRIYDLTDPGNPALAATISDPDVLIYTTDLVGSMLAIGGTSTVDPRPEHIRLYDLSTPTAPKEVMRWIGTEPNRLADSISYRHPYIAFGYPGNLATVLEVSDPANPRAIGRLNTDADPIAIDIDLGHLYSGNGGLIHVFDLSDIGDAQAEPIAILDLDREPRRYQPVGNALYAVANPFLCEIDVSDPSNIRVSRWNAATLRVDDMAIQGGTLYTAGFSAGLTTVDVTDPSNMQPLWSQQPGPHPRSEQVVIDHPRRLAFTLGAQISSFDISDPQRFRRLGQTPVDSLRYDGVALWNNRLISTGLYTTGPRYRSFDITDPASITPDPSFDPGFTGFPSFLFAADDLLYSWDDGLVVRSLSDYPTLGPVGSYTPSSSGTSAVGATRKTVFMYRTRLDLTSVNVANPTNPFPMTTVSVPAPVLLARAVGDKLYLMEGRTSGDQRFATIEIIDITDPSELTPVHTIQLNDITEYDYQFRSIAVENETLFASVSLTEPNAPTPRFEIMSISLPPCAQPCRADLSLPDGVLDASDLLQFVEGVFFNRQFADLNSDGQQNFFDIAEFLTLFNAGCP
ncbi:MAG: GC-type dockerin domain-anchored protein [Planctomycetota bacterium]